MSYVVHHVFDYAGKRIHKAGVRDEECPIYCFVINAYCYFDYYLSIGVGY